MSHEANEPVEPKIVHNSKRRQALRRGQKPAGGWLFSPAMLQLFAATLWYLEKLATERNTDLGVESRVTRIRTSRVTGKPDVFLYPTHWNDPLGIEIKETKGKKTANLYDFMAEASQLVELHHAERFIFVEAGAESPVGPALKFNPKEWVERKYVKPSVKKKGQAPRQPKAPPSGTGPQIQPAVPGTQPQAGTTQPQAGTTQPQAGTTQPQAPGTPAAAAKQDPPAGDTTK